MSDSSIELNENNVDKLSLIVALFSMQKKEVCDDLNLLNESHQDVVVTTLLSPFKEDLKDNSHATLINTMKTLLLKKALIDYVLDTNADKPSETSWVRLVKCMLMPFVFHYYTVNKDDFFNTLEPSGMFVKLNKTFYFDEQEKTTLVKIMSDIREFAFTYASSPEKAKAWIHMKNVDTNLVTSLINVAHAYKTDDVTPFSLNTTAPIVTVSHKNENFNKHSGYGLFASKQKEHSPKSYYGISDEQLICLESLFLVQDNQQLQPVGSLDTEKAFSYYHESLKLLATFSRRCLDESIILKSDKSIQCPISVSMKAKITLSQLNHSPLIECTIKNIHLNQLDVGSIVIFSADKHSPTATNQSFALVIHVNRTNKEIILVTRETNKKLFSHLNSFLPPTNALVSFLSNLMNYTDLGIIKSTVTDKKCNLIMTSGSPGTGKSFQLIEDLYEERRCSNGQILILAERNQAVFELFVRFIRKMSEKAIVNCHEIIGVSFSSEFQLSLSEDNQKLIENYPINSQKSVIFSTVDTYFTLARKHTPFQPRAIFFDEGGLISEFKFYLLLSKLKKMNRLKIHLYGDSKQLLPLGFSSSIFKALELNKQGKHRTLTKQYRMHPIIGSFISQFYPDITIENASKDHKPSAFAVDALSKLGVSPHVPIAWFSVDAAPSLVEGKNSLFNEAESKIVQTILSVLSLNKDKSILILSPYEAQIKHIKETVMLDIASFGYIRLALIKTFLHVNIDSMQVSLYELSEWKWTLEKKLNQGEILEGNKEEVEKLIQYFQMNVFNMIDVKTIDAMQGKEADVVILSLVNAKGDFFTPSRALVGMSRAKECLFIVGSDLDCKKKVELDLPMAFLEKLRVIYDPSQLPMFRQSSHNMPILTETGKSEQTDFATQNIGW